MTIVAFLHEVKKCPFKNKKHTVILSLFQGTFY